MDSNVVHSNRSVWRESKSINQSFGPINKLHNDEQFEYELDYQSDSKSINQSINHPTDQPFDGLVFSIFLIVFTSLVAWIIYTHRARHRPTDSVINQSVDSRNSHICEPSHNAATEQPADRDGSLSDNQSPETITAFTIQNVDELTDTLGQQSDDRQSVDRPVDSEADDKPADEAADDPTSKCTNLPHDSTHQDKLSADHAFDHSSKHPINESLKKHGDDLSLFSIKQSFGQPTDESDNDTFKSSINAAIQRKNRQSINQPTNQLPEQSIDEWLNPDTPCHTIEFPPEWFTHSINPSPRTPMTIMQFPDTPTTELIFPVEQLIAETTESTVGYDYLSELPANLIGRIAHFFELTDLLNFTSVSRLMEELLYGRPISQSSSRLASRSADQTIDQFLLKEIWSQHTISIDRSVNLSISQRLVPAFPSQSINRTFKQIYIKRLFLIPSISFRYHCWLNAGLTTIWSTLFSRQHDGQSVEVCIRELVLDVEPLSLIFSYLVNHWPSSLKSFAIASNQLINPSNGPTLNQRINHVRHRSVDHLSADQPTRSRTRNSWPLTNQSVESQPANQVVSPSVIENPQLIRSALICLMERPLVKLGLEGILVDEMLYLMSNQSVNQSISQPANHPTDHDVTMYQSNHQVMPSPSPLIRYRSINHSTHQPLTRVISHAPTPRARTISQSINEAINQSITQSSPLARSISSHMTGSQTNHQFTNQLTQRSVKPSTLGESLIHLSITLSPSINQSTTRTINQLVNCFPNLEFLYISINQAIHQSIDWSRLKLLTSLRTLSVPLMDQTLIDTLGDSSIDCLKLIDCSNHHFSLIDLSPIQQMDSLTDLCLYDCHVLNQSVILLIQSLQFLEISFPSSNQSINQSFLTELFKQTTHQLPNFKALSIGGSIKSIDPSIFKSFTRSNSQSNRVIDHLEYFCLFDDIDMLIDWSNDRSIHQCLVERFGCYDRRQRPYIHRRRNEHQRMKSLIDQVNSF